MWSEVIESPCIPSYTTVGLRCFILMFFFPGGVIRTGWGAKFQTFVGSQTALDQCAGTNTSKPVIRYKQFQDSGWRQTVPGPCADEAIQYYCWLLSLSRLHCAGSSSVVDCSNGSSGGKCSISLFRNLPLRLYFIYAFQLATSKHL